MLYSEMFYFSLYIFLNFICFLLETYTRIINLFSFPSSFHIIQLILGFVTLNFLVITRNQPGYVEPDKKKDKVIEENKEKKEFKNDLNININLNVESSPIVNLNLMPFSGCDVCKIKKLPLRSHHCTSCQKCVKSFDHHCWILAGCVGENNRFKFMLFLFFQTFSFFYNALGILKLMNNVEGEEVLLYILTFIFSIFCLLSIIFSWIFMYHIYLLTTNQTTFEIFYEEQCPYLEIFKMERNKILAQRGITIIQNSKMRPFDAGMINNICLSFIKMFNSEKDIKWEELYFENIKTSKVTLYCCDEEINKYI